MHQNHSILSTDIQLKKIFEKRKTMVAFRRRKNLGFFCRNDTREDETTETATCKGCKLCRILSPSEVKTIRKNGGQVRKKEKSVRKFTWVTQENRWQQWDIINRPHQNELATHCHQNPYSYAMLSVLQLALDLFLAGGIKVIKGGGHSDFPFLYFPYLDK